jgi:hypothetical protein
MFRNTLYISILLALVIPRLNAQEVSRSNGAGFRTNFWNITNRPTQINLRAGDVNPNVDISGVGGTLFFFTRINNNLFFDLNFEVVASATTIPNSENNDFSHVNLVVPILVGVHYDILPSHLTSSVQPYVSAGMGPYWVQKGQGNFDTDQQEVEGSLEKEIVIKFF